MEINDQPSNVVPLAATRDVTEGVPDQILMRFANMCIKFPPHVLDALILTAMHAKAFHLGETEPKTIQISFDPKDGPYYTDPNMAPEEEPKLILPPTLKS